MTTIDTGTRKLVPFLWFATEAEAARDFYVRTFPGSVQGDTTYYGDGAPMPKGTVLTAEFSLFDQPFVALNGGNPQKSSPAVSFSVGCDSQDEIDAYWARLADGGQPLQCGWVVDRYGFAWQIVPAQMGEWMKDPVLAPKLMQAFMPMVKLDMNVLRRVAEGG